MLSPRYRRCHSVLSALAVLLFVPLVCSKGDPLSQGRGKQDAGDCPKLWPAARIRERYAESDNHILRTACPLAGGWRFEWNKGLNKYGEELLLKAHGRFLERLRRKIPQPTSGLSPDPDKVLWPLVGIRMTVSNRTVDSLYHGVNESYTLEVRPVLDNDGWILLSAPTVYGILHGLQSLVQLLEFGWKTTTTTTTTTPHGEASATFVFENPSLVVQDEPAYPFRGLLIDTSRHYLPLALILTNLEAMELNKLNILHWHMVDSQSWPFQSRVFPELSRKGAYCTSCVYTYLDIQRVVQEAAWRGIRVIVEFDMPGHVLAIGKSHPEWLSLSDNGCTLSFLDDPPLDVTDPAVYDFAHRLYDEVGGLFPDAWIHVGGDKVSQHCWNTSTQVHAWMIQRNISTVSQLQPYFEDALFQYLIQDKHKTPIAWQEVTERRNLIHGDTTTTSSDTSGIVVDVWKIPRQNVIRQLIARGHRVVVSSCWYLDHLDTTVDDMYQCHIGDVFDDDDHNDDEMSRSLLLGGHASMWGETVDETNFLPRVWPRTSAVAEQLWTGAPSSSSSSSTGNPVEATHLTRLRRFRCFLVQQGIPASPLGPGPPCGQAYDEKNTPKFESSTTTTA